MKIAAAYIRVSDERQDEYSPESQIKIIRDWASKNGFTVPEEHVYYDDGISGKSVEKRIQFNRMIAEAKDKRHPFDAILVWKFSRFARNQEESITYKSILKKFKVDVISISEPIMEGHFGKLIERIIEWYDEFYLINLSGEVRRGMTEKASRGEAMNRIYGYDIIDKQYVPNADARIVKEIFELYNSGKGQSTIAKILTNRGIRTYYGNPLDKRYIQYILNNIAYIGKKHYCPTGRAASARIYNHPDEIIIENSHEPIIDLDMWNQAQARLQSQKMKYEKGAHTETPSAYMLTRLIKCSNCGKSLSRSGAYLQCSGYSHGTCQVSHCVSVQTATDALINGLRQAIQSLDFTVEPKQQINEFINYEKRIAEETRKLERAKAAYLAGIDTITEYTENKRNILQVIQALQEKKVAQPLPINPAAFAPKIQQVLNLIENPNVSEDTKNNALHSIIEKVILQKDRRNFEIHFYG